MPDARNAWKEIGKTRTGGWQKYLHVPHDAGRPVAVPRGPSYLMLDSPVELTSGPDYFVRQHPELFATGTTSRDRGYFYWGMLNRFGPPATGDWSYQANVAGGRKSPGGAVVDFVYYGRRPEPELGIRIQTPFFHEKMGSEKQATDFEQMVALYDNGMVVVDVWSQNYIHDPSGRSVLYAVDQATSGQPDLSPFYETFPGAIE